MWKSTDQTTVGRALAVQLGLPLCSLDDVRGPYLERAGYDGAAAARAFPMNMVRVCALPMLR